MDPFEQQSQDNQRPAIITIFAILTIIGVVMTIVSALMPSNMFMSSFQNTPELPGWITVGSLCLAGVKLLAAILLLKMKRMGFFLYVVAESASAILQIIGSRIMLDLLSPFEAPDMPISMDVIILITTVFSLIISLVFILAYASQLNKMT